METFIIIDGFADTLDYELAVVNSFARLINWVWPRHVSCAAYMALIHLLHVVSVPIQLRPGQRHVH